MTLNKRIDVLIDERERQCCELLSFSLSLTSFTQRLVLTQQPGKGCELLSFSLSLTSFTQLIVGKYLYYNILAHVKEIKNPVISTGFFNYTEQIYFSIPRFQIRTTQVEQTQLED